MPLERNQNSTNLNVDGGFKSLASTSTGVCTDERYSYHKNTLLFNAAF